LCRERLCVGRDQDQGRGELGHRGQEHEAGRPRRPRARRGAGSPAGTREDGAPRASRHLLPGKQGTVPPKPARTREQAEEHVSVGEERAAALSGSRSCSRSAWRNTEIASARRRARHGEDEERRPLEQQVHTTGMACYEERRTKAEQRIRRPQCQCPRDPGLLICATSPLPSRASTSAGQRPLRSPNLSTLTTFPEIQHLTRNRQYRDADSPSPEKLTRLRYRPLPSHPTRATRDLVRYDNAVQVPAWVIKRNSPRRRSVSRPPATPISQPEIAPGGPALRSWR